MTRSAAFLGNQIQFLTKIAQGPQTLIRGTKIPCTRGRLCFTSLASLSCPQDEPPYHYQPRCHQHHRHFLLLKLKFLSSSSSDPDYDSKYSDSGYISSLPLPVYVAVQQPTPALPPGLFSVLTFPSPAHTLLLPVSVRQRTSQPCSHKLPNTTVYQSVSPPGLALAEFWKTLGSDHMMALETCQCSHGVGNCKLQGVGIWAFPFL